jgi:2-oxo-3-hexenedioate decarboxylase
VAHSVEIVQSFYPGWKFALPDCTAANGLHGRLVLGPQVPVAKLEGLEEKLASVEVALKKGRKVVERGVGANVLDSPLFALAYLVEVLAVRPEFAQLHAGEIVSTGTLTDAHPVAPGDVWSTAIEGLPLRGLEIHFK